MNGIELRNSVLKWLNSLKIAGYDGRYRLCSGGKDTLATSCAAAFIRQLLNDLSTLNAQQRSQWVEYIQSHQDQKTGYFYEDMPANAVTSSYWENSYLHEQSTLFSLVALDALDALPMYPFVFLEKYRSTKVVLDEIMRYDWREPWYQSNKVMFKLSLLIDDYERTGSTDSRDTVHAILDWLDSWQDPATGVWGTNKGNSLYHGVFTAFHFIYFYFYLKRPVHHQQALTDSCLRIQNTCDGLFSPHGGGGACNDLDAVDILVKCGSETDYRTNDIRTALELAEKGIRTNQNADGGFCWAQKTPFTPLQWLRSIPHLTNTVSRSRGMYTETFEMIKTHFNRRGYPIQYTGREDLEYFSAESDVFSTWFRLLTLALIETRYPDDYPRTINWSFPKKAGLGWHRIEPAPEETLK